MNLPNYFLADLPAEAELTAGLITEACQTLRRNRERYLEGRTTESIIRLLHGLAAEWLSPDFPFRREMLEFGPAATGFSEPVLAAGLDQFFKQLTADNLETLLRQELGHPHRLDGFHPDEHHAGGKRAALARGPLLLAQIAPGNIPNPGLSGMVFGLLTRSAQFVKCASGGAFIPRLFAHSLYEADHKAGSCLEVAEWKGGLEPLEAALFAEADCITATGSDEMLEAIGKKIPRTARFVGYGTRVSFGYVTREALEQNAADVVEQAAADVTAWNQRGCLSPHVIYVEDGGKVTAEAFAALLAGRLDAVEKTFPRGALKTTDAAAISMRRSFYEVRAAHSLETKMWASLESTAWTVILENDPRFQASCANRFIYIKTVADLTHALQGAELVREQVSTVGLSSTAAQARDIAPQLARWGARRVCPLGQMQNPPLDWRHDGRPPLGDLITWTDWEKP
ncbi:MAG: acyl-CoA reductase [Limisphaerales bacterium]